jgi:hypothetical protein
LVHLKLVTMRDPLLVLQTLVTSKGEWLADLM